MAEGNTADDVTILTQLLTGGETGEELALLENLSDESGTGAIVDSDMLDAVVSELCGDTSEEPQQVQKYKYLTHPPVAKRGPITSFCSFVGGKFNKEPEQMVNSQTGTPETIPVITDTRVFVKTGVPCVLCARLVLQCLRSSCSLRCYSVSHQRLLPRHTPRGDSRLSHTHNWTRRGPNWLYRLLPTSRYQVLEEPG